jgi:hypothetical protein
VWQLWKTEILIRHSVYNVEKPIWTEPTNVPSNIFQNIFTSPLHIHMACFHRLKPKCMVTEHKITPSKQICAHLKSLSQFSYLVSLTHLKSLFLFLFFSIKRIKSLTLQQNQQEITPTVLHASLNPFNFPQIFAFAWDPSHPKPHVLPFIRKWQLLIYHEFSLQHQKRGSLVKEISTAWFPIQTLLPLLPLFLSIPAPYSIRTFLELRFNDGFSLF